MQNDHKAKEQTTIIIINSLFSLINFLFLFFLFQNMLLAKCCCNYFYYHIYVKVIHQERTIFKVHNVDKCKINKFLIHILNSHEYILYV